MTLAIGAATFVPDLDPILDWLHERDRDLELQDFCEVGALDRDWRPLAEAARRKLDGWTGRLGIHGPFYGFALDSVDAEIVQVIRKRLQQGLDVCEALGADQMVVHSPITTWDDFNRGNWPGAQARQIETVAALLAPILRRAEDQGVTLVMENIEDRDPAARVGMVAAIGSPALAVSLDTGHAQYAHGATGAPPVDYYVSAAGERLRHVHLQDADGVADRHWAPGEGRVPWPAVFRALSGLQSRPRLVLELADQSWIPKGARWLVDQGLAV